MINVYRTLLLSLLSILYFLGVEVPEVLFGVEQGWETNHEINYQLINSQGVTVGIRAVALWTTGMNLLRVRSGFIRAFCSAEYRT
jgi:hypothetical protein